MTRGDSAMNDLPRLRRRAWWPAAAAGLLLLAIAGTTAAVVARDHHGDGPRAVPSRAEADAKNSSADAKVTVGYPKDATRSLIPWRDPTSSSTIDIIKRSFQVFGISRLLSIHRPPRFVLRVKYRMFTRCVSYPLVSLELFV